MTISGRGFDAHEVVDLCFDGSTVGTVSTNGSGAFSVQVTVDASALPGPHTIAATGESSGLSASATFLVRTDWTMFRFDPAGTGVNPYENVLSVDNAGSLEQEWAAPLAGAVFVSPAVAGGVVYSSATDAQATGYLYAIDARTGTVLWRVTKRYTTFYSDPTVVDGLVYVGDDGYVLHAYDARTGVERWEFAAQGIPFDAVVSGGRLYFSTDAGKLYALNPLTGHLLWQAQAGFIGYALAPAVADGKVFVGSFDDHLYAFDALTGAMLWGAKTKREVDSSAAVAGGVVYVGSDDHRLYAFDEATGHLLWSRGTGDVVESSPAVWNGVVYVGSGDDNVYAVDATTGALKWSFATGAELTLASPIVANAVVYVGSQDHTMYALDAVTGTELWSYTTGDIFNNSPAVADGVLYFGSFDHNLYAFHLPPG